MGEKIYRFRRCLFCIIPLLDSSVIWLFSPRNELKTLFEKVFDYVMGEGTSERLAIDVAFCVAFIFYILVNDFLFDDNCLEINGFILYLL